MRFACLGYIDEHHWNAMTKAEQDAMVEESIAYVEPLIKAGTWLDGGAALQNFRTAKTLRLKDGKVVVTDGPYAETKEQLAGIGVFEARDMDHAVELMWQHPAVLRGYPFELRPIDEELTERCRAETAGSAAAAPGMKVVCFGYSREENWNALSKAEMDALIDECVAFDNGLRQHGRWGRGEALQPAATAKTLRAQNGKVIVIDGPYAETKEQLGGLVVLHLRDMDQAIELLSTHPCLRLGDTLELRPVDEAFEASFADRIGRQ